MTLDTTNPNKDDDLPGMLAVAKAVAQRRWPQTTDAQVWARKFMEIFPHPDLDEGTMIGWFANAIMAGRDTATFARAEEVTPSASDIAMAVARGWCSPSNAHKEMDSELAFAITVQVLGLLSARSEKGTRT